MSESAATAALLEGLNCPPWKRFLAKLTRSLKPPTAEAGESDASRKRKLEELSMKLSNHGFDPVSAMCAIHHFFGHGRFWDLLMQVGVSTDLVHLHNAWVIRDLEETNNFLYERWGEVLETLTYPIMPLDLKSTTLSAYNDKLLAWARSNMTAGAGPGQRKDPDFLIFSKTPAGGNGPYMPVESGPDGNPAINGAGIKQALDEHRAMAEAAYNELKATQQAMNANQQALMERLATSERAQAASERVQAELRQALQNAHAQLQVASQVQPQTTFAAPHAYQPPQAYQQQPQAYQQQYDPYRAQPMYGAPGRGQYQAPRTQGGQRSGPGNGRGNTCDRCGGAGHYARTCTAPAPVAPRGGDADAGNP